MIDVPKQLAERRQWVCHDSKKIPRTYNGQPAKSNDPLTWCGFTEAIQAQRIHGHAGVGFVFTENDGLFGIDLDACIVNGEIQQWAQKIIDKFDTYAEVSPSGLGVKIFGQGELKTAGKKKQLDLPPVGDRQPGIEIYDRGRYFTVTGEILPDVPNEARPCQEALNDFCKRLWPPTAQTSTRPASGPPDVAQRAMRYLAAVPPAISGQGGHNQTFHAACALVLGFNLSPDQAYPLLAAWNATCQPPWTEKELRHKLADADKKAGERGYLTNHGAEYQPHQTPVDLSGIMGTSEPESEPELSDVPRSPHAFPADCLRPPGLLRAIIDYNLQTALYPQSELALAGALALLGTITGRKVQDSRRTRTNIYVLGLAASGAGKEYARTVNKEILLRCGDEGDKMLGPEGFASSAGLVQFVDSQHSILFQLDEIARLLETMREPRKSPHLFKIGSELMKLESNSHTLYKGDAYANQKQSVVIDQPHACIYGTAVPSGFWQSLTAANVSEGLLGRMFVFESSTRYVDIAQPEHRPPPADVIAGVKWWLEQPYGPGDLAYHHPSPKTIKYTSEAQTRLDGHLRGICRQRAKEDDTRAALWSRTTGKTARLALLLACSRGTGRPSFYVEREDVDRAVAISNWLTRRMIYQAYHHVASNEREGSAKKILRLLSRPMTKSELTRKTQDLTRHQRDELIGELADTGLIRITEKETRGRSLSILEAVK